MLSYWMLVMKKVVCLYSSEVEDNMISGKVVENCDSLMVTMTTDGTI